MMKYVWQDIKRSFKRLIKWNKIYIFMFCLF
jgi:hypothetical protein